MTDPLGGKIALPRWRMGRDALAVETTSASDNVTWPGRRVLALAAVILFAGFAVAVLRPVPPAVVTEAVMR